MSPRGIFTHVEIILQLLDCLGQVYAGFIKVLFLGRAPRTKETLPDFLKWRRVTRPPLVFRGLTGSQRTLGFWGITKWNCECCFVPIFKFNLNLPKSRFHIEF